MGVAVKPPVSSWSWAVGGVALLICQVTSTNAQTGTSGGVFEAAATVTIANADQAAAREKALTEALHDAVQAAVVALLGEDEATSRQSVIDRAVLAKGRSFVTGYQVTDEGAADGEYRVAVQAHVATESLRRALEALDAPREVQAADESGASPVSAAESSADVYVRGDLTAARYRSIRAFLERQIPGVRSVFVQSLEAGGTCLRVRGAFPAHALSGYLSTADFGNFRLAVTSAELGPDLEVVVQDPETPR